MIRAFITHKSLCCRNTEIFGYSCFVMRILCTCITHKKPVLFFSCLVNFAYVCRSVWRCCAATVNRTSTEGICVIALFMMWQLMTAKIYLKTSVSGLWCESVCLCGCVCAWIYALKNKLCLLSTRVFFYHFWLSFLLVTM